jgi:transposase InsO family protein
VSVQGEEYETFAGHTLTKDRGERAFTTTFDSAALIKTGNPLIETELFDSGASRHMSGYRHRFVNFVEIEPKPITAADKCQFYANGKGDMYLEVPNGNGHSKVLLHDVLYSPTMGITLVSIGRITSAGSSVLFHGETCQIYGPSKTLFAQILKRGGLYRNYSPAPDRAGYAVKAKEVLSIDEVHQRLGHIGHEHLRQLIKRGLVTGIELDEESKPTFCESCEWGKKHRKPIQKVWEDPKPKAVGEEVHSDLWGKAPVKTINGREYASTFIDGCSSHTRVFLMWAKDETFDSYKTYKAWLKTQYDILIKMLHTDQGGEYMSNAFSEHLRKAGTIRRLTVHNTPEYNGVAERFNHTAIEKVRALLHKTGLPKFLWGEALLHVVYLKIRTWTRASPNATLHEILTSKKPDVTRCNCRYTRKP